MGKVFYYFTYSPSFSFPVVGKHDIVSHIINVCDRYTVGNPQPLPPCARVGSVMTNKPLAENQVKKGINLKKGPLPTKMNRKPFTIPPSPSTSINIHAEDSDLAMEHRPKTP